MANIIAPLFKVRSQKSKIKIRSFTAFLTSVFLISDFAYPLICAVFQGEDAVLWYNNGMNIRPTRTNNATNSFSLVDCLVAGFGVFLRRPFVLLVPLLVDLWLVYGARIAPKPLVMALRSGISQRFITSNGGDVATFNRALATLENSDLRTWGVITQPIASLFDGANSLNQAGVVWLPADVWTAVGVVLTLNLGALLLSTLVLLPLAQATAGRTGTGWRRSGQTLWTLVRTLLLVAGVGVLLGLPTLFGVVTLLAISPLASQLAATAMILALLTLWLFASFSIEAIALGETRPVVALYQSYNLVRTNIRAAFVLILTLLVLSQGFAILLRPLATSFWGIFAASALYAVLSCSIAGARLGFFYHRVALLARSKPIHIDPISEVV